MKNLLVIITTVFCWLACFLLAGLAIYVHYFMQTTKDTTPLGVGAALFGFAACLITGAYCGLFE